MYRTSNAGRRATLLTAVALFCFSSGAALGDVVQHVQLASEGLPSDTAGCRSGGLDLELHRSKVHSSSDGRYVTFASCANDLVVGQIDSAPLNNSDFFDDVFVHDRQTQVTTLVSHAHNSLLTATGRGAHPTAISADGRWILFLSEASTLSAPGLDSNSGQDLYLHDREDGNNILVSRVAGSSVASARPSREASMSADGRYVVYTNSGNDLVTGMQNPELTPQVYLYDRNTGTNELVSVSSTVANSGGARNSGVAHVTPDGRYVSFASQATDLVAGLLEGGFENLFVRDRQTQTTLLASRRNGNPLQPAGIEFVLPMEWSGWQLAPAPMISAAGEVYFTSSAEDIVAEDTSGADVYAFNVVNQTTRRISTAAGQPLRSASGSSTFRMISGNGRWVLFDSDASDLLAGQEPAEEPFSASYLHDNQTGNSSLVSRAATSALRPVAARGRMIDDDANVVLFESPHVAELTGTAVVGASDQVFAFQRATGMVSLLSHISGAVQLPGRFEAYAAALSSDGTRGFMIARDRWYDGAITDVNAQSDVFDYEFAVSAASARSLAAEVFPTTANESSISHGISDDGRWALLETTADNLSDNVSDDNGEADVYLLDALSGEHHLVSRRANARTITASGVSQAEGLSASGDVVLIRSDAPDLVDGVTGTEGLTQLFAYVRSDDQLRQLTLAPGNASGNGSVSNALLSPDGQWVAYSSNASNLLPGVQDGNLTLDVFLQELVSGQIQLVSRAHGTANAANGASTLVAMSGNGRWLLYRSFASNLLATSNASAYYIYDRVEGVSRLVINQYRNQALTLSDDGRWVLLQSSERLDPQMLYFGLGEYVFLHDMNNSSRQLVSRSYHPGMLATPANKFSFARAMSADGRRILFDSDAEDVVPGDSSPTQFGRRSYVFDRDSGRTTLLSREENPSSMYASRGVFLSADGEYAYINRDTSVGSLRTHLRSGQQLDIGGGIGRGGDVSAVSANNNHLAVNTDFAPAITTHRDSNSSTDAYLSTFQTSTRRSWLRVTHTTPQPSAPGSPITVFVLVQGDTPPTDGQVEVQTGTGCLDASGTPDGQGGLLFSCDLTLNGAGIQPILARYFGSAILDPSHTLERYPHSVAGFDFSSLPISYGTRLSDNGPRHATPSALFLGSRPATPENDGPSSDAVQDQEGIFLPGINRNQSFNYVLSASGPGFVNGFADFNGNGQFDLPQEQWLVDVPVQRGNNNVNLAVPINAAVGTIATRYRLSSAAGLNHLGPAPDGEVEDGNVNLLNSFPVIVPPGTQVLLEDSSMNLAVTVSDLDAAPGDLLLSMFSLSPQLLFGTGVQNGAAPNQRMVQIVPFADANGTGSIRLTLRDPEGVLVFQTFGVNVQPVNDAPGFSISGNIRHPDGSSGPQQRVGFASNIVMGPANEASQQVQSFAISRLHDPDDVVDAISLQNDGTLSYELSGAPGTAVFEAVLIDNGGTANGGVDTSTPALFTISVQQTADLAVSIDNGRNTDLIPGEILVYDIRVRNLGPSAAAGMALINHVPDGLGDVSWTCTAQAPAQCLQASGNGGILLGLSNLPAGSELLYRSTGRVTGAAGTRVANQAQLLFPVHVVDTVSANNTAIDDDLISADVLMRDGFE